MSRLIRAAVVAAALGGLVAAGVPTPTPAQEKAKQKDKDAAHAKEAVEIFKDKAGDYRWHVTDADGKVVAMTPKGYATKDECLKALSAVKTTLAKAKVTEVHHDPAPKKDK